MIGIFSLCLQGDGVGQGPFLSTKRLHSLVKSSIDTFIGSGVGYTEKLSPLIHKKCSPDKFMPKVGKAFSAIKKISLKWKFELHSECMFNL